MAQKLNIPSHFCYLIALKTFKKLVNLTYRNSQHTVPNTPMTKITDSEKDILHFIGGSIIHKIENKLHRQGKSQKTCMHILQSFKSQEKDTKSLTAVHDRGGLTYVKKTFTTFLEFAEHQFRSSSKFSTESFLHACRHNSALTSAFYDMIEDCEDEEGDIQKHNVLEKILILFFKIRVHHKCRRMMDEHRAEQKISKKQKGLRKTLKDQKI